MIAFVASSEYALPVVPFGFFCSATISILVAALTDLLSSTVRSRSCDPAVPFSVMLFEFSGMEKILLSEYSGFSAPLS